MKKVTKFIFVFSLIFVFSCNRSEEKQNPIFEKSLPDSKIYKDELLKQMVSAEQIPISYYFNSYEEKDGKEYLDISIEGKSLEANMLLLVKEWDENLKPIKEFKGKGYGGSEMANLKFEVLQDSTTTEFVYVSVDEIVD